MIITNVFNHFYTITHHKILVMEGCFKVGLYKQGLLHDLSKYMPSEFFIGIKYFQGNRSPNAAERDEKGYSEAWLHHKGRNRHHFEYYVDLRPSDREKPIHYAPMPTKYIIEMFIDRVAACKVYNKDKFTTQDPLNYYKSGDTAQFLHPYTRKLLEKLLEIYAEHGEEYTYRLIRKKILKNTGGC